MEFHSLRRMSLSLTQPWRRRTEEDAIEASSASAAAAGDGDLAIHPDGSATLSA